MTPTTWVVLMLVSTILIYTGAAVAYQFAERPGMALTFVGYVIANVGLVIDALK